jgi:amidase
MLAMSDLPQGRAEMQARQVELLEATVLQVQATLTAGTVTSRDLVLMCLACIDAYDQRGSGAERDQPRQRRAGTPQGGLHGIPVVVKDNRRPPASTPPLDRR